MREFRIVIVAHGKLAAALLSSAELICGPIESIAAVGLHGHETPEHFADAIRMAVGTAGPVLILSDLLGGTPHNVAVALAARDPRITCVSGVNLAMVVEAVVGLRTLDEQSITRLIEAARDGIAQPQLTLLRG